MENETIHRERYPIVVVQGIDVRLDGPSGLVIPPNPRQPPHIPISIVDGADEVHKRTVAHDTFENVDPGEIENLLHYEQR
ncbi:hypothetical protein [Halomicrococcus sp. NG-SE-24]|uniref:hypothetical protein n=1 Tax=Halomicrococcus sp. NG-SE-24 TaxID=3436928 RepID=UPI003D98E458